MTPETAAEVAARVNALERDVDTFCQLLESKGWGWAFKSQTGAGMMMPYGSWYAAKSRHALASGQVAVWPDSMHSFQTGRKGLSDRVLFTNLPGKGPMTYCVEMKTGSAVQSDDQREFEKWCVVLGMKYVLCRTKEDLYREIWRPPGSMDEVLRKDADYDWSAIPF